MSGAKRLIALTDVEAAHAGGLSGIQIAAGTVVTPLARDVARRLGIRLERARGARLCTLYANWKANGRASENEARARAIAEGARAFDAARVEVAIFPPFPHLALVRAAIGSGAVALGAQDLSATTAGAFTGAVPASMLTDLGCRYALCGHSERRQTLGDGEQVVRAKLERAIAGGIAPVLCVGETLAEREAGRTFGVLRHQLLHAVEGLGAADAARLVVAYEPVWAIGSGLTPTAAEVDAALVALRDHLARRFGDEASESARILYGGSVTPTNAAALLGLPSCDGGLVGGASLDPAAFLAIARALG